MEEINQPTEPPKTPPAPTKPPKKKLTGKQYIGIAFAIIIFVSFVGKCPPGERTKTSTDTKSGEVAKSEQKTEKSISSEIFTNENWDLVDFSPNKYIDSSVVLTGQIFTTPEKDDFGVYFQMWADPKNNDFNTFVTWLVPTFDLKKDDYIRITGVVSGEYEGENAYGGPVRAPSVDVILVEKISGLDVLAPAINTVEANAILNQHGVIITIEKIEFAVNETRFFIKIKNGTNDEFSAYEHNAKAVQESTQYEREYRSEEDGYPKLQTDLLSGIETSGIITFKPLDYDLKKATLIIEGRSDNYNLKFELYTFNLTW